MVNVKQTLQRIANWEGLADPGVYRASNRFWLLIGCIGLYGYAFFTLQPYGLDQRYHNLMLVAFLPALVFAPKPARMDPVVYLALGAIVLALFSYAQSNLLVPQYAEPYPFFNKALGPFLFFVVAWWLGGSVRSVFMMLAIALAGLAVAVYANGRSAQFLIGLSGERVDLGFWNAQHTAMFFGVALIGWSVFSVRIVRSATRVGTLIRGAFWLAVFLLLFAVVIITQTRAAWLGLAAAMVVGGAAIAVLARRPRLSRRSTLALFVAVLLGIGAAWPVARVVQSRLHAEQEVISQVGHEDAAQLPESSIGIRIKLWTEAMGRIEERPWIGWGYMIRSKYIADSPNLSLSIKEQFGHVHNSYLELLLIYGVAGLAFMSLLVGTVGVRSWQAWRAGIMPSDVMLFGICFFAFWVVANMFESYVFGKTGTYLVAMAGGALYTFPLAQRQRGISRDVSGGTVAGDERG